MTALGRRQHALIAAAAGDLIDPPAQVAETFGPRGSVTGARACSPKREVRVSRGVIDRLANRGLYWNGRITEAGFAALEALRTRRGRRT